MLKWWPISNKRIECRYQSTATNTVRFLFYGINKESVKQMCFYLGVLSKETALKTTFEWNTMIFCVGMLARRETIILHMKKKDIFCSFLFRTWKRSDLVWLSFPTRLTTSTRVYRQSFRFVSWSSFQKRHTVRKKPPDLHRWWFYYYLWDEILCLLSEEVDVRMFWLVM